MSGFRIVAIRLLCPDPARTARFYAAAFGAGTAGGAAEPSIRLGGQSVELVRTRTAAVRPGPSNATTFQHCAIVVSDMAAAMGQLGSVQGWTPISRAGPERLPASSGGVTAFKFRDPDGHPLELLQFAPTTLPEAWSGRPGLFLGIDHTAIAVADTERSIAFYADLGFRVTSRGINRGVEQERLDDVTAPCVEVTGLAPSGGRPPHLELLCYREPGPLPVTQDEDAVLATRTVLQDTSRDAPRTAPSDRLDPDGHRLTMR